MAKSGFNVKEAFYTLQGEGARAGRASVFIRFSKCNLWNGKESGRGAAVCQFCDTDIVGTDGQNGGTYNQQALVELALSLWPQLTDDTKSKPYVVFTGGEPALQLTESLVSDFQQAGFECAVESNGTLPLPTNLDWVCISPKGTSEIVVKQCDELKLVYPQVDLSPDAVSGISASYFYLSPMADYGEQNSGMIIRENMQAATQYCLDHPQWRMSLQTHKLLGID
ncbi:7-carboxy-7-deazaguanine synthase [Bermanella marisrubri]|uniref:7-carboxy-7-deazaguanine synthase n=1 Tax=Bermanella marisrubri TaxID=207949 RepID=Q1N1N5_9GAMM|nr:7-carboxy-7-deazaguanine synthase [Bermanella marisrubri]EAT12246.1 Organic radical activating enzyme [Oceanobacter sp. RED65] [Bermanella marisrubri]QIZ83714.1 7-carboxy-7-deazaguanine synthase [Bermanella marisrubri]